MELRNGLARGEIIPYLGPGVLDLIPNCPVPASPAALVAQLVGKVSVPYKVRKNLTAAAQFIENFKHRKSLVKYMTEAFLPAPEPSPLHRRLAESGRAPGLIVSMWYDGAMQSALAGRKDWGMIQGVSQSEHFGTWVEYYGADGSAAAADQVDSWNTVLYQPLGAFDPGRNFLVSDTDFVEVMTEIDIQTPIPEWVQRHRAGRHFLFLGCRFDNQLERTFARQIMKRSSSQHWAVLPGVLTRNERRFLEEQHIQLIDLELGALAPALGEAQ